MSGNLEKLKGKVIKQKTFVLPTLLFLLPLSVFSFSAINSIGLHSRLTTSTTDFAADGISGGKIVLSKGLLHYGDAIEKIDDGAADKITVLKKVTGAFDEAIYFRSTFVPGRVELKTRSGKKLLLNFYKDQGDLDNDGFSDRAEIQNNEDRRRFLAWFVRIAESQFLKKNYSWSQKEQDCSGLIRYAYREALKKHDESWQRSSGIILDKNLADVTSFNYPDIPIIGKKLFRITDLSKNDKETFGEYADAEHLMKYNARFISREIADARTGDVLFFYDRENTDSPSHSMIVSQGGSPVMVIYHTGSEAGMKRIPVEDLDRTNKFAARSYNPNFAGVYRFHIVD